MREPLKMHDLVQYTRQVPSQGEWRDKRKGAEGQANM